jgi:hypothetical protein
VDTADAVLVVVGNEIAGGGCEDSGKVRRRMEGGIGHEVQRGLVGCGAGDGPDKAVGQEAEQLIDLLVVMRVFG